MTPGDLFGKLEPSALFLLERSADLARSMEQEFDTLHIMLIALVDPESTGSAMQSFARYIDDDHRKLCESAIKVQLQLYGRPATMGDGFSANLTQCAGICQAEAQRRSLRVTEALILWAVAQQDPIVSKILRTLAIDHTGLGRDLERHFEITSKLPPLAAGLGSEGRDHTEIISPTTGCQFANAHGVLMANVLNVLGKLEHSQMAVLIGRNGMPIYHVGQALADLIAADTTFSDERPRLQHDYAGVYQLNLGSLRDLARIPNKPQPFEALQVIIRLAIQQRAILILRNMELLRHRTEADDRMLAVLSNPGDALILGLYEQGEYGDHGPIVTLDLSNIVSITAHAYSPLQTKLLIRNYYAPHWLERYSMMFHEDAFDHIIALEPGAWINARRETLPYLAVGLASNTIQTVLGGESLVRDTAVMALDAIEKLREEWATTEPRIRHQYETVLEESFEEISALLEHPMPEVNNEGHQALTRAHVTAQLICPNDSEFHYPGHAPESLASHLQDDLPVHLREVLHLRHL